jgi:hypothetical protein
VKDENGDLLADFHNILNRRKNYYSQLLNVLRVSDVRQIEIHTAEPLVPDPSPFEVEIYHCNLNRHKSLGSDQIPAELIQAGGETLRSEILKFINSIWTEEHTNLNGLTLVCNIRIIRRSVLPFSCLLACIGATRFRLLCKTLTLCRPT